MRRRRILGGLVSIGLAAAACGGGGSGDQGETPPSPADAANADESPGFHDKGLVKQFDVPVRGTSAAQLHYDRVGMASFEISYVRGESKTVLFRPDPARPINLIADARAYGPTTLVCVNTFASRLGEGAQVECVEIESETGKAQGNRTIAPGSWLRSLSLTESRAYVSPNQPFNYDENAKGLECRSIGHTSSGLQHDPNTPFACDEQAPRAIPKDQVRGYSDERTAAHFDKGAPARAARALTATPGNRVNMGDIPTWAKPMIAVAADGGSAPIVPIAVADAAVPVDGAVAPPAPDGGAPPPPPPPPPPPGPSDEDTMSCGMRAPSPKGVDVDLANILPGGALNGNYVKADCPSPGLTTGVTWSVTGKIQNLADENSCLHEKVYGSVGISGGAMFGKYGFNLGGGGHIDKERCSTPHCDPESGDWSCVDPSGSHLNWGFNVNGRGQVQIPLDTIPYLKPICQGNWSKQLGLGVSCNIDLSAGVAYQRTSNSAEGKAFCGSGCDDGQATSSLNWSVAVDGSATLEVEAQLGWLANGRVGINVDGSYTYNSNEALACNNASTSSSTHCFRSSSRIYATGCVGNLPGLSYCFNWSARLYKIGTGDCPPEPGDPAPGDTPGTGAGNMCAANVTVWAWATRYTQCVECCNKLPFPPAEVQSAGEFDKDCKAVCDAAPWN